MLLSFYIRHSFALIFMLFSVRYCVYRLTILFLLGCGLSICLRRGVPLPHLCSLGAFSLWKSPLTAYQQKRFFSLIFYLTFLRFACRRFLFNLMSYAVFFTCYRCDTLRFAVSFVCAVAVRYTGSCCSRVRSSPAYCTIY